MALAFTLVTEEQARELAGWRYEPPYDFNDFESDGLEELLDRDSPYYAATDPRRALAGFCCFGPTAQVPKGHPAGACDDHQALDIGLGLRPDLTGQGLGAAFLDAVLAFACDTVAPVRFRVSVVTWNRRAILVYERAGFRSAGTFESAGVDGAHEFLCMIRDA